MRELVNFQSKKEYHYINDKHYVLSTDFETLLISIYKYCFLHHIYVNRTTIEGSLITDTNIDKFVAYSTLLQKGKSKTNSCFDNAKKLDDKKEQAALIRLMCHGRLELSESISSSDTIKIEYLFTAKTNWICNWLTYYFNNYIEPLPNDEKRIEQFKNDFSELYFALQRIKEMI